MSKIVFFDIDGTLYSPQIGIPDSAIRSVKRLIANGNKAILCTGRGLGIVPEEYMELGFHGIVASAGAHVICEGKELYNQLALEEDIKTVIDWGQKKGLGIVLEGKAAGYFDEDMRTDKIYNQIVEDLFANTTPQNYPLQDGMEHVNKWTFHGMNKEQMKEVEALIDGRLVGIYRDDANAVEFVPKGINKAVGVEKVLEYFGIDRKNSYAFGDSANDLDMLQFVEYGVAMGNAVPSVLKAAKYQTAPIHEDGIEKALKKFELI